MAIRDDLTPQDAPAALCELSPDVRAAVLLDAAGSLVAASNAEGEEAGELADLVRGLVAAADKATEGSPPEQIEVQVERGAVFASRDSRHVLAAVTRRTALNSLMLFDMRVLVAALGR